MHSPQERFRFMESVQRNKKAMVTRFNWNTVLLAEGVDATCAPETAWQLGRYRSLYSLPTPIKKDPTIGGSLISWADEQIAVQNIYAGGI